MSKKGEPWSEREREAHAGNRSGWMQGDRLRTKIHGKPVLMHRHIMEEHIGRPLERDEVVHHINGDPLDNRLENLCILKRGEHSTKHKTGATHSDATKAKMSEAWKHRAPPSEETKAKTTASLLRYYANLRQKIADQN